MRRKPIVVTANDLFHLERVLHTAFAQAIEPQSHLEDLQMELRRARIVKPSDISADVVTMNSIVVLVDLDDGSRETFTLVYPDRAEIASGQLSILSPIGTAILGYRVGDVIRWRVPAGMRRLRVEEVLFQPEREALFQL